MKPHGDTFPLLHCLLSLSPDQAAYILQSVRLTLIRGLQRLLSSTLLQRPEYLSDPAQEELDKLRRDLPARDRRLLLTLARTPDPKAFQVKFGGRAGADWCRVLQSALPFMLSRTLSHGRNGRQKARRRL